MARIKCTVDECHYWDDEVCRAEEIQISSSFKRQDDPDLEVADEGGPGATTESMETQCVTFRPGRRDGSG